MTIKMDGRALTDALVKLEQAADSLPQVAAQVRAETLGHLILGANRNVYSTAPGAYQRTGELRQGLSVRVRASRTTTTVEAVSASDHAASVEFGQQGMTGQALQALSLANPDPRQPLSLGRSGRNWTVSGPIVAPAQAFALYRLRELFAEKVRARR